MLPFFVGILLLVAGSASPVAQLRLALSSSELICAAGKDYVKVRKVSGERAAEESYQIYDQANRLATSPAFSDNTDRVDEYCINASENHVYVVHLRDSFGNSWSAGSFIEIISSSDVVVLKTYMTALQDEQHTITLYEPINENSSWKYRSGSVDADWKIINYSDSDWNVYIYSEASISKAGTQYYRKTFYGSTDYVAYELRLKYRYGIVVYLNMVEIYRDNMDDGPVSSTDASSGYYLDTQYHSIIVPKSLITAHLNALCVELHFPSYSTTNPLSFAAVLFLHYPSEDNGNCYVIPYQPVVTSPQSDDADRIVNWNRQDAWTLDPMFESAQVDFNYTSIRVRPFINALRLFSGTDSGFFPHSFTLAADTTVLRAKNLAFSPNQQFTISNPFVADSFFSYRMTIAATQGGKLVLPDLQLAVCVLSPPEEMELNTDAVAVHTGVERVLVYPKSAVFSECSIQPSLPSGLSLDGASCEVSGVATQTLSATRFTLSSSNGAGYSASFSLEVSSCTNHIISLRYFSAESSSADFAFTLENAQHQTLFQSTDGPVAAAAPATYTLCTAEASLTLLLSSARGYWSEGAFVEVSRLLDASCKDVLLYRSYDSLHFGVASSYTIALMVAVPLQATWFYLMSSVPENWYASSTAGWKSAVAGQFGTPVTTVELYKTRFTVTEAELARASGVALSVRYHSGILVYLNAIEVFRYRVVGELTASSQATDSFDSTDFHFVAIPFRTAAEGEASQSLVSEGTNMIAIALVSGTTIISASTFDATLRLMKNEELRSFEVTATSVGLDDETPDFEKAGNLFELYYERYASSSRCDSSIDIAFKDGRKEWISSVMLVSRYTVFHQGPLSITVRARVDADSEWVTISSLENMVWWEATQMKQVHLLNSKPYGMYRIEGLGGSGSSCSWEMNYIGLLATRIESTVPSLAYPEQITVYRGVEMAEVYPGSSLFTRFTVTPSLPEGLLLDTASGVIVGVTNVAASSASYTISAMANNGQSASTSVFIRVTTCDDAKNLITAVFYLTEPLADVAYVLKDEAGSVVSSASAFPYSYRHIYQDFCLSDSVYTLSVTSPSKPSFPAGVMLYTGAMDNVFDLAPLASTAVSLQFSSALPLRSGRTQWSVYVNGALDAPWKDGDKRSWQPLSASTTFVHNTVYLRTTLSVASLATHRILNVFVQYKGGVAAYFNGRLVARFNLRDHFSFNTLATTPMESATRDRFHVVLELKGAVAGANTMVFELHRGSAEDSEVVFDATGVFGINDCSIAMDSLAFLGNGRKEFFDLDVATYASFSSSIGTLEWRVTNGEGSVWNTFGMLLQNEISCSFSLYGKQTEEDEWSRILQTAKTMKPQNRNPTLASVANAGFQFFRLQFNEALSSPLVIQSLLFMTCAKSTVACAAIEGYESVGEGEIAYAPCEDGYEGYAYRKCSQGQWGSVETEHCTLRKPSQLAFTSDGFVFVMNTAVSTGAPDVSGVVDHFELSSEQALPDGLAFDAASGAIEGTPVAEMEESVYSVTAVNNRGTTVGVVRIRVRVGSCPSTELFSAADLDVKQTVSCSKKGSYMGSVTGTCVLGKEDGEWRVSGLCWPRAIMFILILLVLVVVFVLVVVLFAKKYSALKRNQHVLKKQIEAENGKPNSVTTNGNYLSLENRSPGHSVSRLSQVESVTGAGSRKSRQLRSSMAVSQAEIEMASLPAASRMSLDVPNPMVATGLPQELIQPVLIHTMAGNATPRMSLPANLSVNTQPGLSINTQSNMSINTQMQPGLSINTQAGSVSPTARVSTPHHSVPGSIAGLRSGSMRSLSARSLTPHNMHAPVMRTPRHVVNEGVALTPRHVVTDGVALTPRHIVTEGVALTPRHVVTDSVSLTPRHVMTESVSLTPRHVATDQPLTPRSMAASRVVSTRLSTPLHRSSMPRALSSSQLYQVNTGVESESPSVSTPRGSISPRSLNRS